MIEMKDIIFCNNRKCKNYDCLRHHTNAPYGIIIHQFRETPTLNNEGKCKHYLVN